MFPSPPAVLPLCFSFPFSFVFLGGDGGCLFFVVSIDSAVYVVSVVVSTVAVSFVDDSIPVADTASDVVVLGRYFFFLVTWVHPSSGPL